MTEKVGPVHLVATGYQAILSEEEFEAKKRQILEVSSVRLPYKRSRRRFTERRVHFRPVSPPRSSRCEPC